jgi:hypothetical protein
MTIEVRTLFAFQLDKEREPTYILYLVRLLQQAQIRPSQNLRRLRAGLVRFVGGSLRPGGCFVRGRLFEELHGTGVSHLLAPIPHVVRVCDPRPSLICRRLDESLLREP